MRKTVSRLIALGFAVTAIMLAGCSGSGVTAPPTVSGIAATGMPIVGQVRLKDSSTTPKELTAPTGTDGSFVINVAGLTPPFILKIDWTAPGGAQALVSFAATPGTANITPISQVIVANAAGVSDPTTLYETSTPASRGNIASALKGATTQVMEQLKPLFDAYGVTFDPMTGPFAANHVGLDAMLDAVKINLVAGTVTVSNRASGAMIFSAPATNLRNGSFMAANMPAVAASQGQPSLNGTALYAANCAGCHGALTSSTKVGASVASIQSAINAGIGGMGSLSALSSQQIQAITTALGTSTPAATTAAPTPVPAPSSPTGVDGVALYASKCAGCHGTLASSNKKGITGTRLQSGINNNMGGMGYLSTLSTTEIQAIVSSLTATTTPAPSTPNPTPVTPNGASLYAGNCAGCHGALATSNKKGTTLLRLQGAISNNTAGMGMLSTLSSAELQAIVNVLPNVTITPAPAPTPTPTPAPSATPVPTTVDGASLYTAQCASCHGALATTNKKGATATRLQTAINNNAGGMGGLSSLTTVQVQAIATALATTTIASPIIPTPTTPTTTAPADGAALYASKCASCHGQLASSNKAGATLTRTQTAISGNLGGMGSLSSMTTTELQAVVNALAKVTPPTTTAPTPACGSCHAIPPSTGRHSFHSNRATCATCHGTGFSTTTVNAATHNNGVKNLVTTIGWNATARSCANSCHGTERW